jgi:curved DNA-binding protein
LEYKDYYSILGVPRTADDKQIKAAYRKLARKHHPDVNKGDKDAEAKFKEVGEAYTVLSDPEKRRRYDAIGPDWASAFGGRRRGGAAGVPGGGRVRVDFGSDAGGFSDFFRTIFGGGFGEAGAETFEGADLRDLFGGRAGAQVPARGQDAEVEAEVSLEEVLRGARRTVRLDGRSIEVTVPPGVRHDQRVRLAGAAGGPEGAAPGHLYLLVKVRPHPTFEREGDDLRVRVTVPLTTAVLGGEAHVPTLEGGVATLKVPPGSQPGRVMRLKGLGLPRLGAKDERGGLLAVIGVDLPGALGERERALFEELRKLGH